jgi:hypothetical protein
MHADRRHGQNRRKGFTWSDHGLGPDTPDTPDRRLRRVSLLDSSARLP